MDGRVYRFSADCRSLAGSFTSPTRDNRQIDIVISVTPRVLRAPAVTPRDEEMRPSGTLQSPTTGSLAEMIRDADREDQIAAARVLPTNVTLQLPDAPLAKQGQSVQNSTTPANLPPPAGSFAFVPDPAPAAAEVNSCANHQTGNGRRVTVVRSGAEVVD